MEGNAKLADRRRFPRRRRRWQPPSQPYPTAPSSRVYASPHSPRQGRTGQQRGQEQQQARIGSSGLRGLEVGGRYCWGGWPVGNEISKEWRASALWRIIWRLASCCGRRMGGCAHFPPAAATSFLPPADSQAHTISI